MSWVWVLSFTVLGSKAEHVSLAKFETKSQCQTALEAKRQELKAKGSEIAAHCYLSRQSDHGWWK
jgi:hypothetical protein